ncbi:MAG: DinB family protein [Bryobacteraceae bacterium]
MIYDNPAIAEEDIPRASSPLLQVVVDTYVSESNKVIAVWRAFSDDDLNFKPHPKSASVRDIMHHQLLSERRFFSGFLETPEPDPDEVLPPTETVDGFISRFLELVVPRVTYLAELSQQWWLLEAPFFDVRRQHVWIFWRRVLHTAHHRTQLSVYLRLLNKPVPPTYGPTADATWDGADPTHTIEAASH